ncbi:MAG TPA: LysE family transporter [Polyangiales bacterium]|nr:LysE family transporter [Polyangiales bacterium]
MPVAGPVAVIVFGRGIEDRGRSALYIAIGSAVAESVYAYLAFWGFSAFLTRYRWIEAVSTAAAAIILCGLGLRFMLKRATAERPPDAPRPHVGKKRNFFLGFMLTALNPTLIATWTAAVTTVYSLQIVNFDERGALPFSIGAMTGIVSWFGLLLYLLKRFRALVSPYALTRVLKVMGGFLVVLGVGIAVRFAYRNLV